MGDKTHLEVNVSTRNQLREWKAKHGFTYSEAIEALLKEYRMQDDKSVELYRECPECGYRPDDHEGVWTTVGQGQYTELHYVDCPECDARWPFAARLKPGVNADIPEREEILTALGR